MRKLFSIIKREYVTRVKTRGFIIGTVIMPVLIILVMLLPTLFLTLKTERLKEYVVVDLTEVMFEPLVAALNDTTENGIPLYQFSKIQASSENLAEIKARLTQAVDEDRIDSYIVIPRDVFETNQVELYSKNVSNFRENEEIERAISRAVTRIRLDRSGLDPQEVNRLVKRVDLRTFKVGPGGTEEEDQGITFIITYILVFFLYMALIIYGTLVMRSVIEEKSSRVVEVLVSSVKPFQLMAGKVIGIGAVGLTQFLIWALVAGLASLYGRTMVTSFMGIQSDFSMPTIQVLLLFYFILFFVLGYFFYATMYAGLGALVNTDQEAQQLQFPLVMFLVLALMFMFYVINNPDDRLALILSMLPLTSPIIMFTRIAVLTPPFYQILASVAILILSIWGLIWFVGKIFRVGILMYGKRPTLQEVVKWIKYS